MEGGRASSGSGPAPLSITLIDMLFYLGLLIVIGHMLNLSEVLEDHYVFVAFTAATATISP